MRMGVREICEVVLRAKANQKVGNRIFYKNEPVIYFDTLKTSSLEGAATTVYATGGRGNARLMAWEGERTLTFTMEDALISPEGFMILSGAGLIEASEEKPLRIHQTERTNKVKVEGDAVKITLANAPYFVDDGQDYIYVMQVNENGEISSEPYIATKVNGKEITIEQTSTATKRGNYQADLTGFVNDGVVFVDYYVERKGGASQITITPDKFGGYYYLEASTLFRDEATGVDMPAEFIIPRCKIQSNFTFTMAATGDPSTFSFTLDAFPDYTRFDPTKKVLSAIQIITDPEGEEDLVRIKTASEDEEDENGMIYRPNGE